MSKLSLLQMLLVCTFLLAGSLTLSACQSQPPATSTNAGIDQISISPVETSTDSSQFNTTSSPDDLDKGPMTKTLADLKPIAGEMVKVTTTKGDFSIKLYRDKAPLTTLNFLNLVQDKFYDGIVFHRVIPGFMAQVGDPLTKDDSQKTLWGTGGPGYTIADEFGAGLKHDKKGIISMANAGANTGGSQIFIIYAPQPHLDGVHAVFGEVVSGMDIVDMITVGDKIISAQIVK